MGLRMARAFRSEPLLLFLVIGIAMYAGWSLAAPTAQEPILVENETLRFLEQQQEDLLGRPLTAGERETIKQDFIDEEVLLREAFRRGLHETDSRVRRRLVAVMRSALTDVVPDPTSAQLQTYFQANIDRFTTPESVTLEQVLFPWGSGAGEEKIERTLRELRAGADARGYGVDYPVGRSLARATREDLVISFGAPFTDQIDDIPTNVWIGPIESPHGQHLVRVIDTHVAIVPEFESIESYLRQDWLLHEQRRRQHERIEALRQQYRVDFVEK